ncbi:MAG: 4Fe-4S dicluster domain-containing protein [Anaerolineae bacterium]|nr:4Fe-4S dicluster domain-containing protein [Anaerolineae bacterium]
MTHEIETGTRIQAKRLLDLGEVSCVIGHERSPRGPMRPAFIYDAAGAERLAWDRTCHHNLVVYLRDKIAGLSRTAQPGTSARVAVVARPCDVRALNVLIHEGQVARESVFVVGVACPGMLDGDAEALHCRHCAERVPIFYDALVGDPPRVKASEEPWPGVAEIEAMSPAQRLAFWVREFDRCIRCYACRQACPACYCFECIAEQVDPPWVSMAHHVPQKAFFHIMRAYHLAGRCSGCQACEAACPVHLPLSLLNRKIAAEVEALFGYVAGADPDTPPPLATFRKDEELPL